MTIMDNKRIVFVVIYEWVNDDEAMDNPIDDFCIHEDELEEHTEEELVKDYILNEFNQ